MTTRLRRLSPELEERLDALLPLAAYQVAVSECRRSIKENDVGTEGAAALEALQSSASLSKELAGKLNRLVIDMDLKGRELAEELNDEDGSAIRYAKARALASLLRLAAGDIKESMYESIMSFEDPQGEVERIMASIPPPSS